MDPKFIIFFYIFDLLCRERVPIPGQKMAAGARVIRDSVISVILAGVSATLRKWRCSRRQLRVLTASMLHLG